MLSVWVVGLVVGVWLSGWLECSWNWDICGPKTFFFFLLFFVHFSTESTSRVSTHYQRMAAVC